MSINGIWYNVGEYVAGYGDKYSGGFATYPYQSPMAQYCSEVNKTFFVFGGAPVGNTRLLCQIAYYDHATKTVSEPVTIREFPIGYTDTHANPCICIGPDGYIIVVSASRGAENGHIYRSDNPYDITSFTKVHESTELAYTQLWYVPNQGYFLFYTYHVAGRKLYFKTSVDGITWPDDGTRIAGYFGHYSVTWFDGSVLHAAFNYHPDNNVDLRKNLYYVKSDDFGTTWKNAAGTSLTLPLADPVNDALIYDTTADGLRVYPHCIKTDATGNPIIMFGVSTTHLPGPTAQARLLQTMHYTGGVWVKKKVAILYHNYSVGSLQVESDGKWRVFVPSDMGPYIWRTGGEIQMRVSADAGTTWTKTQLTSNSQYNHTYCKPVLNAQDDFYAFWADGNPDEMSDSCLYFTSKTGAVTCIPNGVTRSRQPITNFTISENAGDYYGRLKETNLLPSGANKAWGNYQTINSRLNSYIALFRVKFEDLISSGQGIISVKLKFFIAINSTVGKTWTVYRLLTKWGMTDAYAGVLETLATQEQATFNNSFASANNIAWAGGGAFSAADYVATPAGSVVIPLSATAGTQFEIDISDMCKGWSAGDYANNGFAIISNEGTQSQSIHSSESVTDGTRPSVVFELQSLQSITFPALPSKAFGNADFSAGATASSGLAVTYASSDTNVATIVDGNIHIVGAGTATITASQAGDGTYAAAVDVAQVLTVLKLARARSSGGLSVGIGIGLGFNN